MTALSLPLIVIIIERRTSRSSRMLLLLLLMMMCFICFLQHRFFFNMLHMCITVGTASTLSVPEILSENMNDIMSVPAFHFAST